MELTFQQEAESSQQTEPPPIQPPPQLQGPSPKIIFGDYTVCARACLLELYLGILFRTHLVFKFRQVLSIVNEINQLKHT